jgi:eukaryotic-like serine/threonine-protein kinase
MSHALVDGTLFAGRYRVLRCIAAGGMGAVYEVLHVETDRRRALKVMLPEAFAKADMRERFKREAKIAANIDSEHIVDVFDAGIDDATGMPFLVMELLRGEEIGKRLKRVGRFSPAEVLTYLRQTAHALDRTHRASIVHRDLKPGNLFLAERDDAPPRIKVLDFGIAKLVAEASAESGRTQEGLGTPLYMAPEQWRADARLSQAVDLYAFGQIAYTLLAGAPYWREELKRSGNIFAFAGVAMLGIQEPPTARAARAGVTLPPAFDGWFATATALRPEDRFARASAAVEALAEVLGEALSPDTVATPPPEMASATGLTLRTVESAIPVRARASSLTGRGARLLAGVAALGLLALGAAFVAAGHASPPEAATAGAGPAVAPPSPAPPPPVLAATSAAPLVPPGSASAPAPALAPGGKSGPAPATRATAAPRRPPPSKAKEEKIYNRD